VFVLLVVALLGTLLGRLAVVQIGEHDDYARAATRVNTRVIVQPAIRGRILDATRKPLAGNTSAVSVTVERAVLLAARDGGRDLIGRVVALLGMPFVQLWGQRICVGRPGRPGHFCASTARHTRQSRSPGGSTPNGRCACSSNRRTSPVSRSWPSPCAITRTLTDSRSAMCWAISIAPPSMTSLVRLGRSPTPSWSDGPVWRRSMTRFFVGSVAVPPCPSTPEVLSQARSRPPTRSPAKISSLT
jgi:hypothetical protein